MVLDGGITNQKIKTIDMKKISGRIRNTPPTLPNDGVFRTMAVPFGTPIEGVKVTDGEKVVLSDKNGFYEIETAKGSLVFSKENYISQTIDLNAPQSHFRSGSKDIVLKKLDGTTSETKSNSEDKKTSPFVWVAIGIAVVGLGWWYYKSKKQ